MGQRMGFTAFQFSIGDNGASSSDPLSTPLLHVFPLCFSFSFFFFFFSFFFFLFSFFFFFLFFFFCSMPALEIFPLYFPPPPRLFLSPEF